MLWELDVASLDVWDFSWELSESLLCPPVDNGLSTATGPSPSSHRCAGESQGHVGLMRPHTGAGLTRVQPSLPGEPLLWAGLGSGRQE